MIQKEIIKEMNQVQKDLGIVLILKNWFNEREKMVKFGLLKNLIIPKMGPIDFYHNFKKSENKLKSLLKKSICTFHYKSFKDTLKK